ncbi:MAG: MlaD family protein [Burkholderiaceae bacterium]|jgi:phospholipid/cholesterol/gamma-HCH transport system substrate-binding protein|nr:MlaD family protein [Burkholderiaceae bacterium]
MMDDEQATAAQQQRDAREGMDPALARRLRRRAMLLLALMLALVVGAVLYLMWARGAFEDTQRLVLTADDSDGVVVGMDMTFSGFPIGRVVAIELGEGGIVRVLVDVRVKEARWLRKSSVFTLERGLMGGAHLRAYTGVMDDEALPPGAERQVLRGDMAAEIPRMVADARAVLQNISQITADQSALNQTLADLGTITARIAQRQQGGVIGALTGDAADAKRLSDLLDSLASIARRVDGVAQKIDRQLMGEQGMLTDAHAAVRDLGALLKEARAALQKADTALQDMQAITSNARAASANLGDLRADVENSLLKVDQIISEINRKWPFAPTAREIQLP